MDEHWILACWRRNIKPNKSVTDYWLMTFGKKIIKGKQNFRLFCLDVTFQG